jgi:L-lysine 2,3-aminomutase
MFNKIHNKEVTNKSVENVAKLRNLGTTVTNQNYVQEEITAV